MRVRLASDIHDHPGNKAEEHQLGHDHDDPQTPVHSAIVVVVMGHGLPFAGVSWWDQTLGQVKMMWPPAAFS